MFGAERFKLRNGLPRKDGLKLSVFGLFGFPEQLYVTDFHEKMD
ncbi:hypothetical protein [Spirosoma validum]